ncbi:MAG: hypothetical protein WAO41_00325 [Candidatus Nanopelagicales bacterium]
MTSHATGQWEILPDELVTMRTEKLGPTSLEVRAPVVGGMLEIHPAKVLVRLELSLARLKASNFLMQGAARALVRRYDGDSLVFAAEGKAGALPWRVSGQAQAGTIDIPMTIDASPTPPTGPNTLQVGGTVTMNDVEIPIPGLSGISSITFDLNGILNLSAR